MRFLLSLFLGLLINILCATAHADRILLTGKPIELIPQHNYYLLPKDYVSEGSKVDYHYVVIAGDRRVCFLSNQPELKTLDLLRIEIVLNEKKFLWYCYKYNPFFFEVDF